MDFRPLTFLRCLTQGHRWRPSHSKPGHETCVRCRLRRLVTD
jgi:hypothetical protein